MQTVGRRRLGTAFAGTVVAALLAALLAALVAVPPAGAVDPGPVRILLLGDSVTQGSAGDWTWRYRLWQHLVDAGVAVDFVGPRDDLVDNVTGVQGSHAYADPDFDRDHAARWGMWAVFPDVPVEQLVREQHPDVVVSMLGVNDLLYGVPLQQLSDRTAQIVQEARTADPGVDVVLAEATQTWFPGVPEFDALLRGLADDLTSPESRVVVATTSAGYQAGRDTWDNAHPNARGEVRIAAAVANSLAELGVGPPAGSLPAVEVGPRVPASLSAVGRDGQATLTWTSSPGATAQVVWTRDATRGQPWTRLPDPQPGTTWTSQGLVAGHTYQYRVQPMKGDDLPEGTVFSNAVSVTAPGSLPLPAPAAVRRLHARAHRTCAVLAWRPAPSARRYVVQLHRGHHWRTVGTTHGRRLVVRSLPRSRSWRFRVTSWRGTVRGRSSALTVRRGVPGRCR